MVTCLTLLLLSSFVGGTNPHAEPVAASVAPQGGDHVVVVSRTAAAGSALFDVDLTTGTITPLGRFSLDSFPPLAVAVDAVNRDVVVALQTPASSSVLVRLEIAGTVVRQQATLGDVPGTVTALAQGLGGSWVSATAAGVWVTERHGSVARRVLALSDVSALETFGHGSAQAIVAQSGSATSDPSVRWIDLTTGSTIAGPWVYVGHTPRGIRGIADLPTGASRQVLAQEDGTIALSLNFINPTVLPLTPVLPAGATDAMHVRGLEGVVLGNRAHPYLKSFQALGGTQWTMLAGPLSGDPVDFAFRPAAVAATVSFGSPCAGMLLSEAPAGGPPRLGNGSYGLQLANGRASAPAFLALGASDRRAGALRLPAPLPGGCSLLVSTELLLPATTNAFGEARLSVPVPNAPQLLDAILFAQWLQVIAPAVDASDAAAIWIGA